MRPHSARPGSAAPREIQRAALARASGVDEAMIERLVNAFYGRVREDDLLAPVFAEKIDDWPVHLRQMYAFWSSVVLGTGR